MCCAHAGGDQVFKAKILVADDDRDTAEMLGDLLRLHAYDVRVAFGGPEAAEIARSFLPDLCILDVNMPALDGYATARLIKSQSNGRQPVLLAFTSNVVPSEVDLAHQAEFDHHLPKSVGADVLLALVEALAVTNKLANTTQSPIA